MNVLLLLVAFAAGSAISAQAAVNSQLAGGLGGNTVVAALISFVIGTLVLAAVAFGKGGISDAVAHIPQQPLWRFGGGFLGAAAIFSTVLLAPRIGLANMLALVIAGQLVTSITIDQFGLLGMAVRHVSSLRIAGAAVLVVGVLLMLFGDALIRLLDKAPG
ncbi:transporter family-2 protein [Luteibacter sp. Sphag1AF]|uniref:DMT family transporter n=1 Tax=Luteibacter sp. Sphag1AF TaxID=2587031 RepID=UPI00161246D6|nr:DMT family transporter [Luteibacter sp. Sphag1AF]MBB3228092.1 transporter family-2 protein [Luteibacter sp. Sphag1AF]